MVHRELFLCIYEKNPTKTDFVPAKPPKKHLRVQEKCLIPHPKSPISLFWRTPPPTLQLQFVTRSL